MTVWTDFSAAILDFNILLTGYDVISMNIRDILINGQLPVTTYGGPRRLRRRLPQRSGFPRQHHSPRRLAGPA